jgi:hypothetical protein
MKKKNQRKNGQNMKIIENLNKKRGIKFYQESKDG